MPLKQPPRPKRKIVHLGNVGEDCAYRSKKLASACQNLEFYGIDLKKINDSEIHHPSVKEDHAIKSIIEGRLNLDKPKNLHQIQADFIDGLKRFPDNHLDIISSDFSVGYYDHRVTTNNLKKKAESAFENGAVNVYTASERYTQKVVDLIYRKLKSNGKFIAYYFIDKRRANAYFGFNLRNAIKRSKFLYVKEEKVNIAKIPPEFRSIFTLHLRDCEIYRVIAIKE